MIRKALLFTALATVIGASAGAPTVVFAASQGSSGSGGSKAAMFDKCDKNGDGSLTADEFKACHHNSAKAEKKFKSLDTNHDGAVSREEAQLAKAPSGTHKSTKQQGGMPSTGGSSE